MPLAKLILHRNRERHQWYTLTLRNYKPWGQSRTRYRWMSFRHSWCIPKLYCRRVRTRGVQRLANSWIWRGLVSSRDCSRAFWRSFMLRLNRIIPRRECLFCLFDFTPKKIRCAHQQLLPYTQKHNKQKAGENGALSSTTDHGPGGECNAEFRKRTHSEKVCNNRWFAAGV